MEKTVLIVDDEKDIVTMLSDYFRLEEYFVIIAQNGSEAIKQAEKNPDIILLDINMPDIDGLEVCHKIRNFVTCPILFLTAKGEDTDKIRGFAVGGDDYITKPFSLVELGARVSAHLRREVRHKTDTKVKFADGITIDYYEKKLYWEAREIPLAKKEFDIVELLSQNVGQIFDKERIYERVWSYDAQGDSSVVAEHIRRIRGKLANVGCGQYIETAWGVGYRWKK